MTEQLTPLESYVVRELGSSLSTRRQNFPPWKLRAGVFESAYVKNPRIVQGFDDVYKPRRNLSMTPMKGEYSIDLPAAYSFSKQLLFEGKRGVRSEALDDVVAVTAERGSFKGTFFETSKRKPSKVTKSKIELYDPVLLLSKMHIQRQKEEVEEADAHSPLLCGWRTDMTVDEIMSMKDLAGLHTTMYGVKKMRNN